MQISGSPGNFDSLGNLLTTSSPSAVIGSNAASPWTSGTAQNAAQSLLSAGGFPGVLVQFDCTAITGGAVTFQGTYDGVNWVNLPANAVLNPQTLAQIPNPYTLVPNANSPILLLNMGFQQIQAVLTTPVSGSGSVALYWLLMSSLTPEVVTATDGALATEGATTDTAVLGDTPGTLSAKQRGINLNLSTRNLQQQRANYRSMALTNQGLQLQMAQSGGFVPVPEIPEFLGEY